MTNTLMLEMAIRRAGLTKKEVAHRLNLSVMGLHQKVHNITEFKASEIAKLYEMLNLSSLEEQQQIFLLIKFTLSKQRGQRGAGGEGMDATIGKIEHKQKNKVVVPIEIDTTPLDEAQKKADKLKATLLEVQELIRKTNSISAS